MILTVVLYKSKHMQSLRKQEHMYVCILFYLLVEWEYWTKGLKLSFLSLKSDSIADMLHDFGQVV